MRWIALAALLLATQSHGATVRTWTDDDGVVHFSDRPLHADVPTLEIREPNIIDPYRAPPRPERPEPTRNSVRKRGSNEGDARRYAEKCMRAKLGLRAVQNQRRRGYRPSQDRALRDRRARYQAERAFYCE